MVASRLEILLQELGQTNLMANLVSTVQSWRPNASNTCLIPISEGLNVQLELDKTEKNLMVGCVLGSVPPSPYRHKLFVEALRANGMPPPRYGILAYSNRAQSLVLFDYLDVQDLTGHKISEYLMPYLDKAKLWKEAIDNGTVPVVDSNSSVGAPRNLFGLKF